MQITVNRKSFLAALEAVGKVVEKKSTIPILTHCQLIPEKGKLTVIGTDLEQAVQRSIMAAIDGDPVQIIAPHGILVKFLKAQKVDKKSADKPVVLDYHRDIVDCSKCAGTGNVQEKDKPIEKCSACDGACQVLGNMRLTVDCGAKATFNCMDPISYPEIPTMEDATPLLSMSYEGWTEVTDKVTPYISAEESRFTLNGFLLEIGKRVKFAATDGHRLALVERGEIPNPPEKLIKIVIPKYAAEVIKAAMPEGEIIHLVHNEAHVAFVSGDTAVLTRKLSGNFPDYERVIPQYEVEPATMKAADLVAAIDGIKHCSDERSRGIRVRFNCEAASVYAEAVEVGRAEMTVPCSTGSAHGVEVGFNWGYVRDFCSRLPKSDLILIYCDGGLVEPQLGDNGEPVDLDWQEKVEKQRIGRAAKGAWMMQPASDLDMRVVIMPLRI